MRKPVPGLFVLILVFFSALPASFASEGMVIAGEDDVLRFDVSGGIASPAPGISMGGSVLWTKYRQDALGVTVGWSRHELVTEDAELSGGYLDFAWERSIPIWGGYHAVRLTGMIGLGRSQRDMDEAVALQKGDDASVSAWGIHAGSAISLDMPLADLVWGRLRFDVKKTLTRRTPTQVSVTGGVVWGGQWLGIGD